MEKFKIYKPCGSQFAFALLRSVVDFKNSLHFLNQLQVKPNPIVICPFTRLLAVGAGYTVFVSVLIRSLSSLWFGHCVVCVRYDWPELSQLWFFLFDWEIHAAKSLSKCDSEQAENSPFIFQNNIKEFIFFLTYKLVAMNRISRTVLSNLVSRAFSSFKMAVGETPGQGCWNTPRIVEYFVTWHMMKRLFRRLALASGGPVCLFALWNCYSNGTNTFQSVYVRKF